MRLSLSTKGFNDLIDITDQVKKEVARSQIDNGLVLVFVPHQTCAVSVLENEPGLIEDLKDFLKRLAPLKGNYRHNTAWDEGNGAAHLLACLFKPSLALPLENRNLTLGQWQKIILLDFDNRPRQRQVVIKIIKEG